MKLSIKTLLNYIAVSVVFAGSWNVAIVNFAEGRVSYLIMAVLILLWIQAFRGIYFNKPFFLAFSVICFFSLYNVFIGRNALGFFTKQLAGISLSAFFFYLLLKINDYDVKKLFKVYLNIAFVVALIGIFQEISYTLGFKPGYDFSYLLQTWKLTHCFSGKLVKVNSIMPEPAHFCNVMVAAFFVSVVSFLGNSFRFQKRWKSLVIIFSYFLSFSGSGYAVAFFSLILLMYCYSKSRYFIVSGIVICTLLFFFYKNLPDLAFKAKESVQVLTGDLKLEEANQSTYSIVTNLLVAYNNFKDNPFFGTGLGSHQIIYHRYIGNIINVDEIYKFGADLKFINIKDANSLFSRLLSETGLFGILVVFIFIFKCYVKREGDKSGYLWIISNAVLTMFFIKLLRMGNYFVDGFLFFFWIYYFTKKTMENKLKAVYTHKFGRA